MRQYYLSCLQFKTLDHVIYTVCVQITVQIAMQNFWINTYLISNLLLELKAIATIFQLNLGDIRKKLSSTRNLFLKCTWVKNAKLKLGVHLKNQKSFKNAEHRVQIIYVPSFRRLD